MSFKSPPNSWHSSLTTLKSTSWYHCAYLLSAPFSLVYTCIYLFSHQFSSVDQFCTTLCDPMNCSTPGLPVITNMSLLKLMSIKSVMPSSHLILSRPLLLLPPIPPSIRVFSNESTLRIPSTHSKQAIFPTMHDTCQRHSWLWSV